MLLASWLGLFARRVAQLHLDVHLPAAAEDRQRHLVVGLVGVHRGGKILRVGDLLPIHGDDQVAAAHHGHVAQIACSLRATVQTGFLGGAAGQHSLDENTVVGGQSDLFGDVGTDGEG